MAGLGSPYQHTSNSEKMKESKTKPVQIVMTYNGSSSAKGSIHAKLISVDNDETTEKQVRPDDNHKLVRRYSFDDNGGGYLGL